MIESKEFYQNLQKYGINFFAGVPDSLLKDFCAYITDTVPENNNIIAANEGSAIALAAGYHLATSKIGLVYMQNSGFGNTINPLLSLVDPDVYNIPILLLIGWRGEPGKKDEPQHVKQGKKTIQLLQTLDIPYTVMDSHTELTEEVVKNAYQYMANNSAPFALVVSEGSFNPYSLQKKIKTDFELNRESAIQTIIDLLQKDDIIISTTGKTSRELFEYREKSHQGHGRDFLTVGSMGHASQIAMAIALSKPDRVVFCFDGDGAAIMHLGSLAIIGNSNAKNFKHIIINNGSHDSVGGQPTVGYSINFNTIALGCCYKYAYTVDTLLELKRVFPEFYATDGPSLLEIRVNKGARNELGRPTTTPVQNKKEFMSNLNQ